MSANLVFIHGLASNHLIWQSFAHYFSNPVTLFDIPGYGEHQHIDCHTLDTICTFINEKIPGKAVWIGWSLGGLIAEYLANTYPEKTLGVITLASNPQFVQSDDWSCAISQEDFNELKILFQHNTQQALSRFLSLQLARDSAFRLLKQQLSNTVAQYPIPDIKVLMRDFQLLEETNHRPLLSRLRCPQLHILGEKDNLVPRPALKDLCVGAQNVTIADAAHVPFLSHGPECFKLIHEFLHESIDK